MAVEVFHYNDKTKEYKSFNISPVDDKSGVFVSLAAGTKNSSYKNRVVIKLSKQELAYLILESQKLFDEL